MRPLTPFSQHRWHLRSGHRSSPRYRSGSRHERTWATRPEADIFYSTTLKTGVDPLQTFEHAAPELGSRPTLPTSEVRPVRCRSGGFAGHRCSSTSDRGVSSLGCAMLERRTRSDPTDLSDAEWSALEPLLPSPARTGRPLKWSRRLMTEAIFYLVRSRCAWWMLPFRSPLRWRDRTRPEKAARRVCFVRGSVPMSPATGGAEPSACRSRATLKAAASVRNPLPLAAGPP